jgi:hypothetical protein
VLDQRGLMTGVAALSGFGLRRNGEEEDGRADGHERAWRNDPDLDGAPESVVECGVPALWT